MQFYRFSVKSGAVHRFYVTSGTVLQVLLLRAGQIYKFLVKSRTLLQVLCYEWDSSTGSLLRVGQLYRFFV
jgi:hypothetical protein